MTHNCDVTTSTLISNLPDLCNIIDDFQPPLTCGLNKINGEDIEEICESLLILLDIWYCDNIKNIMYSKYEKNLTNFIKIMLDNILDDIHCGNESNSEVTLFIDEVDREDIIQQVISTYNLVIQQRSYDTSCILFEQTEQIKQYIDNQLDTIRNKDKQQPAQKSIEWHQQRYNLISASVASKALGTQSAKNSIIYSKCQPLNTTKVSIVNINSPFHWGQKYEPISQMYYEHMYNTKIEEFGCIIHDEHTFLGASPDGINVERDNDRYGRMLEIKNIVNREINGIPKTEYWVQMQMQMECCNLNECDFLECRFIEYENKEVFDADGTFMRNANDKLKGIIMCFFEDTQPLYEYAPFNSTKEEIEKWQDDIMDKHADISWIKNIYWKLEEVSCVLVPRQPEWFKNVLPEFCEVWNTIEKERISGYEHRQPTRRNQPKNDKVFVHKKSGTNQSSYSKKTTTIADIINNSGKMSSKLVIKINTSDI